MFLAPPNDSRPHDLLSLTLPPLPMHRTLLALALLTAAASAAETQVITIKTPAAQMRYDVSEFTVSPGADVRIILENLDDMPHNLVLFQAGTDVVAVAAKNMEKPEEAMKRDWLPVDPRMLAHSKAVAPKTKDEIVFKAPDKPGSYPYVCTFPGHALSMQGKMKVAAPGPGFTSLKFALYLGDWKKLPDFAALAPHREGEVAGKQIEIKLDDYKNQFGVVYTGKLNAPKDGEYTFAIAGDDGVRLSIDGKKVVEFDGIHPSAEIKEGKVKLKAGEHELRMEYFQATGESDIYAAWRSEDFTNTPLSKWVHPNANGKAVAKKKDGKTGIPLVVGKEPIVYRNFIANAGGRPIAVGYPGGFNLAWSVDQLNLSLLWRGAFMDAALHWIDRGGGEQPPLGYDLLRPAADVGAPFAVLASTAAEWPKPDKKQRAEGYQWRGYALDAKRVPTFSYEWNGVKVSDRYDTEGDATGAAKLVRTLKLAGPIPANAFLRVANGTIQPAGSAFQVNGGVFDVQGRSFENQYSVAVDGAQIAGRNLLVPARAEIKITYTWPNSHAHHAH